MDRRQPGPLILAALLLLTVAIYAPMRTAGFVYEDENWQTDLGSRALTPPSRALTMWTYRVLGPDPGPQHVANVALHLANGALVYAIAAAIAPPIVAPVAAGVFLLHPLNSEAVCYLSARTDLLMTFWILVALACLVLYEHAPGRWPLVVLASSLWLAACSKEIGLVGVPLVVLAALLVGVRVRVWRVLLAIVGVAGSVLVLQASTVLSWLRMPMTAGGSGLSVAAFVRVQSAAAVRLLALVIWPVGFTIDHDPLALGAAWGVAGILLVGAAVLLVKAVWWTHPVLTLAVGWIGVALLPRIVFATSEFLSEAQLYLAMVGVSLVVGTGVSLCLAHLSILAAPPQRRA